MQKIRWIVLFIALFLGAACLSSQAENMDFTYGSFLYQEEDYLLGIPGECTAETVARNFTSDHVTFVGADGTILGGNQYVGTGTVVRSANSLTAVILAM